MNTQLIPVAFLSDTLYLIDNDNQPFIPVKPIADNMGLAWQPQHRKLNDNKAKWGITMMVIPTPGGDQEMLSMPLRKLPAYLYSIDPRKVKPESREKIERYQAECDDVLWQYWSEGHASRPTSEQPAGFVPMADFLALEDDYFAAADEVTSLKEEVLSLYRGNRAIKEVVAAEGKSKLPVEVIEVMARYNVPRDEIARLSGRTRGCLRVHLHNARKGGRLQ